MALLAPVVSPYAPNEQDLSATLEPASAAHLLGTDDLGRDTLSRLIWGARSSLYASILAVLIAVLIGVPVGLAAGLGGKWADIGISRTIDALLSFPAITLAVGVTGVLGVGLTNGMIAVGITFSPQLARLVRSRTLVGRGELYVDAARVYNASPLRIALRHVLPNAMPPVIVQISLLLAGALLAEAALSFLGLGVQPPTASWGAMLARAYNYMDVAPAQMYPPGVAVLLTAMAFNALGESMRSLLDPMARR
ncbi:MAG: ABC transporter permease [Acetobacteraceae bacterium]|nr:ABC transporter permease [Acetobacteraceae bacterium]